MRNEGALEEHRRHGGTGQHIEASTADSVVFDLGIDLTQGRSCRALQKARKKLGGGPTLPRFHATQGVGKLRCGGSSGRILPRRNLRRSLVPRRIEHEGHDAATIGIDRKSTRLNSSHSQISYAVFCLKKKIKQSPIS